MWLDKLTLVNIRCFDKKEINFSRNINVLIGENNSGKSTILNAIRYLEGSNSLSGNDLRIGTQTGLIAMDFNGDTLPYFKYPIDKIKRLNISINHKRNIDMKLSLKNEQTVAPPHPGQPFEPYNFIYPYISRRKVGEIEESHNLQNANMITGTHLKLYSKIARISDPTYQPHDLYMKSCREIIGFNITAPPSEKGVRAAYVIEGDKNIPIDKMGEGIANILGLIVDLAVAKEKLFLIEEPENDIHPLALKKLLDLIEKKSKNNQFIITTHSNIVTKYFGIQEGSKLFEVSMVFDNNRIPTSNIEEIKTPEERIQVLGDLGYSLLDYDLWDGWLFLEESSAEKIIRKYLIPWFVPELINKIKTFSAGGLSKIKPRFEDFTNLMVFIHLQPIYINKAWVILDGGDDEEKKIEELKGKFKDWKPNQFCQFKEHDFEKYYPDNFQNKIDYLLKIENNKEKREAKKLLLKEVEAWIKSNEQDAKKAFEKSAKEVIEKLQILKEEL